MRRGRGRAEGGSGELQVAEKPPRLQIPTCHPKILTPCKPRIPGRAGGMESSREQRERSAQGIPKNHGPPQHRLPFGGTIPKGSSSWRRFPCHPHGQALGEFHAMKARGRPQDHRAAHHSLRAAFGHIPAPKAPAPHSAPPAFPARSPAFLPPAVFPSPLFGSTHKTRPPAPLAPGARHHFSPPPPGSGGQMLAEPRGRPAFSTDPWGESAFLRSLREVGTTRRGDGVLEKPRCQEVRAASLPKGTAALCFRR